MAHLFSPPHVATVTISPEKVLRSFQPETFFGAALDGDDEGTVARNFRPHNVEAMRSAGFRSFTYRLRTELAGEAWHWNPVGTWSDPAHKEGYWTSDATPGSPIQTSWGYRLPRRGNTFDQANNDGYSRIDDGDPNTYWKSNPYLDATGTPQWIVIDLKRSAEVDTLRIHWANPYAVRFRVEYWRGRENVEEDDNPDGAWLPLREVSNASGGDQTISRRHEVRARFLRLTLIESSRTSEPSSHADPRDGMGFAVREIEVGTMRNGRFHDTISHLAKNRQTPIYTSSTDPWHRSCDIDPEIEQPGFDRFFRSGFTGSEPALVPVSVYYDTPENAIAELRWLKARGYPVRGIELGEEPDGQCIDPEQYANLFALLAEPFHRAMPGVPLGGPSLQTVLTTYRAWPQSEPRTWTQQFADRMRMLGKLNEVGFFSFEWYPSDHPFGDSIRDVATNSAQLREAVAKLRLAGLPKIPWYIAEYGYSAFAGPSEVDLQAALLNLDTVGAFLELGGSGAFLYGLEPGVLDADFPSEYGNMTTWLVDAHGDAKYPMPIYWAARMLTQDWCAPSGTHQLVRSSCDDTALATYTVKRPDGTLALLVLNKDENHFHHIRLRCDDRKIRTGTLVQFGREQYAWHASGESGHPDRSLPPKRSTFAETIDLPPYSASVVQINLQNMSKG